MKFTIFKTKKGEYSWRLVAANGEKICHGEGYTQKHNAIKAILLVQKSGLAIMEDKTI
jgi:uncharacterized protein YegP (UPF0339 family)